MGSGRDGAQKLTVLMLNEALRCALSRVLKRRKSAPIKASRGDLGGIVYGAYYSK